MAGAAVITAKGYPGPGLCACAAPNSGRLPPMAPRAWTPRRMRLPSVQTLNQTNLVRPGIATSLFGGGPSQLSWSGISTSLLFQASSQVMRLPV